MKRSIILVAALFALVACEEKKPETKTEDPASKNAPATTTPVVSATAAPAPAAVAINEADLSTPADFEEAAEKAIDKKNYKAELATIEGDIAKE